MKALTEKTIAAAPKKLAGKVALVTGGSRGIGAGIALRLAEQGADVAITYSKSKNSADNVAAKISELGVKAAAFKADASSAEQAQRLVSSVLKQFGKIDILVNNAGVFELAPLENITLDHYYRVFGVNVEGVLATTSAAAGKLSDGGRIINISSVAATGTMPGTSVYSASKAALDALTRVWAQELGPRKITVNGVAPGPVSTDMFASVPEELKQQFIEKTALRRVGEPEDIAAVVAFLASADGGWITGQTLIAGGGILA